MNNNSKTEKYGFLINVSLMKVIIENNRDSVKPKSYLVWR